MRAVFLCDAVRTPISRYGGARLALTAAREMERLGGKRALAAMCIGAGQGIALALERV